MAQPDRRGLFHGEIHPDQEEEGMDRAGARAARVRDAVGRGDQAIDRRAEAFTRPRRRYAAEPWLGRAEVRWPPQEGPRARRRHGTAAVKLSSTRLILETPRLGPRRFCLEAMLRVCVA